MKIKLLAVPFLIMVLVFSGCPNPQQPDPDDPPIEETDPDAEAVATAKAALAIGYQGEEDA